VVQAPSCPYKYPLTRKIGGRKEETEKKRMKRAKQKNMKKQREKRKEKSEENPLVLPREKEKLPDSPTILLSPSAN